MATIADYSIISDNKINLQVGADIDHTFSFTLPSNVHFGSRSILAFVAFISSGAESLRFTVRVNGSQQIDYTFSGFRVNTLHEVISPNLLKTGTNTVEVRVESGDGVLSIGDMVLWWQATV